MLHNTAKTTKCPNRQRKRSLASCAIKNAEPPESGSTVLLLYLLFNSAFWQLLLILLRFHRETGNQPHHAPEDAGRVGDGYALNAVHIAVELALSAKFFQLHHGS